MNEIIVWIEARGRFPRDRSEYREERSMARWFAARRREAARGTLHPTYSEGLARIPGGAWNPRIAAEEARWRRRLDQLADFREEGSDWPRHKKCDSEREHTLGVWVGVNTSGKNIAGANSTQRRSISWTRRSQAGGPGGPAVGHLNYEAGPHGGRIAPRTRLRSETRLSLSVTRPTLNSSFCFYESR
jgi:hypothetical protein